MLFLPIAALPSFLLHDGWRTRSIVAACRSVVSSTCCKGRMAEPLPACAASTHWLALYCLSARPALIAADPLTVILYGDAKPMPSNDKAKPYGRTAPGS